jgi:tRNA threonylcarbamoyladenosine biosynthesis protein TsaB
MNLLAFDTSTEVLSIAVSRVVDGHTQVWQHQRQGGAQASISLIAGVMDLLQQAQLELSALQAVCFGNGPGSFTGLRTACSVAQGLAFGAGVPVLAVDSLLAVAEDARHAQLEDASRANIMALLDARMDEMYQAHYAYADGSWTCLQDAALVRPEEFSAPAGVNALAGNVFGVYAHRLSSPLPRLDALPTAAAMLRLAPQLLAAGGAVSAEHALPRYVRDKVAKTTVERDAEKAAALATRAAP